jgi:hypothetical protein
MKAYTRMVMRRRMLIITDKALAFPTLQPHNMRT